MAKRPEPTEPKAKSLAGMISAGEFVSFELVSADDWDKLRKASAEEVWAASFGETTVVKRRMLVGVVRSAVEHFPLESVGAKYFMISDAFSSDPKNQEHDFEFLAKHVRADDSAEVAEAMLDLIGDILADTQRDVVELKSEIQASLARMDANAVEIDRGIASNQATLDRLRFQGIL
jgi:hypothetical protein